MGWENLVDVCGHLHGKVGDYVYRYYPGIALQRVPCYTPTNPRTGKQQTWREIFAQAIAAWKALSGRRGAGRGAALGCVPRTQWGGCGRGPAVLADGWRLHA
jgi:hypothetical protein